MSANQDKQSLSNVIGFHVQKPLRGYDVDPETLRRLYRNLSEIVGKLGDATVASLSKPDPVPEEEFENYKRRIRSEAFKVTVSIEAEDGTIYVDDNPSIFDEARFPSIVKSIYFTNKLSYKSVFESMPADNFDLYFDFSKPPLLDWSSVLSAPTSNNSNVSVDGYNILFKNSIISSVIDILNARRSRSIIFHKPFMYDFGLFLIAMPYAFYLTSKLSRHVLVSAQPIEWRIPLMAYSFMTLLMIYRIMFSYFKWAFPVTSFSRNHDSSSKHRALFTILTIALLGSAIWDGLKWAALS